MDIYTQSYYIPGTLVGDLDIRFTPPAEASLVHISAAAGNTHTARLSACVPGSGQALLPPTPIGCGGAPVEIERRSFAGEQHPRLKPGQAVRLAVAVEADAPPRDVTLVLTFMR